MAYVPPHLRKTGAAKETNADTAKFTINDIQHHYWRHTRNEDVNRDTSLPNHSTLNDSAESKGLLSYVLLFYRQNPRWESAGIIFVKSNLDILPQYREAKAKRKSKPAQKDFAQLDLKGESTEHEEKKEDGSQEHNSTSQIIDIDPIDFQPEDQVPVACFEERRGSIRTGGFQFVGYYKIERVALLAPYSKALTLILEQKWALTNKQGDTQIAKRKPENWDKSLSYEWAVVKFVKMDGENVPPQPEIEKLSQKSVNEMLAEMRIGKSKDGSEEKPVEGGNSTTA